MAFVRCLECGGTFQHSQAGRHWAISHPDGPGVPDVGTNRSASGYPKESR